MKKRPVGVTILAVFQILNAVKKLAGVGMALGMESIEIESSKLVLSVLLAGFQGVVAVGLFKGLAWAHALGCVALSLRATVGLMAMPNHPTPQLMLAVCTIMLAVVVYLVASKTVRAFFYGTDDEGSQQCT